MWLLQVHFGRICRCFLAQHHTSYQSQQPFDTKKFQNHNIKKSNLRAYITNKTTGTCSYSKHFWRKQLLKYFTPSGFSEKVTYMMYTLVEVTIFIQCRTCMCSLWRQHRRLVRTSTSRATGESAYRRNWTTTRQNNSYITHHPNYAKQWNQYTSVYIYVYIHVYVYIYRS